MMEKSKLEEKIIAKDCIISVYITADESSYILQIDYLKGKFISEKFFSNDLKGIEYMEDTKELFKTEHDIKEYFGII